MQYTGAQILIESLIDQGVDTLFGYPGGAVLNIYDALYESRDRLNHILTSHEQGAAHAADGYARSTGRTGVVLATSGPGATNLVTGIATAHLDSIPLVAITGNVTKDLIGRDSFQEVDIVTVTNPIVKHNYLVQSVDDLAGIVREAFTIANSGRKGPVHIDIPKDITAAVTAFEHLPRFITRPNPQPSSASLEEAARAIQKAQRPLIYCGGGVTFSNSAAALQEFARLIDAPVCASMMGISSVPASAPNYLGLVGMHGTPFANWAITHCDLLLVVGARFSDRVAGNRSRFAEQAVKIQIDIDAAEVDKNLVVDQALIGDAGEVLGRLQAILPPAAHAAWMQEVTAHKDDPAFALPDPSSPGAAINPRTVIQALSEVAGPEAVIVTDVGQHQMFVAQYYPFQRPRSFLTSGGFGTMGYGMGAANGAAMGNPARRVALVTGDGSFHMNLAELAVAVSNDLPIVVIIMNNRVLGMVHQWQKLFYGGRYSQTQIDRRTNYQALAEAFGAVGFVLDDSANIRSTLEAAFACGRPCVIDCRIDALERVFPIVPPGLNVDQMIFSEDM